LSQSETTTIKEIKCKRLIASPKKKNAIVGYCSGACHHLAEFTQDKTCLCCTSTKGITRNPTYDSWTKRFDGIIEDNLIFLEGFRKWPTKPENRFYAWIKMGLWTYKIDIKFFAEYMEIVNFDDDGLDRYAMFFEYIIKICPRLAL
jgi:hypothetical protein